MGFEIFVRPAIFPNIRPAPAQSRLPQDDPEKGFAIIRGNGGKSITLTSSYSASTNTSKHSETQRRVDKARVYQKDESGKVNKENFIDIEVANRITMKGPAPVGSDTNTEPNNAPAPRPEKRINVPGTDTYYYSPMSPGETVEIIDKDKIIYVQPK